MQGKKKLYSATIFACLKEHRMLCSPKTSCILCINFTVSTACRGLLSRHHPKIHKYMISCYLWVTWLSQSGFWLTHWFICSLKDNFSQNRKKLIKKKLYVPLEDWAYIAIIWFMRPFVQRHQGLALASVYQEPVRSKNKIQTNNKKKNPGILGWS